MTIYRMIVGRKSSWPLTFTSKWNLGMLMIEVLKWFMENIVPHIITCIKH